MPNLQPSASRTSLLLACPRPFDPELEVPPSESGEAANYGSAFHLVLAECLAAPVKKPLERSDRYAKAIDKAAKKYGVRSAAHELAGHVKSSAGVLRNWLVREKLKVAEIERSYAVSTGEDGTWYSREIPPHDEEHRYAVGARELPGTVDLVARDRERTRTVVLDHKTGSHDPGFSQPAKLAQMKTLGLIGVSPAECLKHDVEVAIFHADRRGLPIVYADLYSPADQKHHARALHEAFGRIGSGFMRPGDHCKWCPARDGCPARTADLLAESTAALVEGANKLIVADGADLAPSPARAGLALASVEERAGVLYELLKSFRALDEVGSKEIKNLVREGKIIETRDGKVLTIREEKFETLSKKSVIEALGKVAGEKELTRLRKKGAIKEATREKLVAEK